jgi:hypothetical protein
MIQRRRGLGFAFEAFEREWIAGEIFGEKFERDETIETRILGLVNDAHSATAEIFGDAVVGYGAANQRLGVGHARLMVIGTKKASQSCG